MLEQITQRFEEWGFSPDTAEWLTLAAGFALVVLLAIFAFFITKQILLRWTTAVVKRTSTAWDDHLLENRVFFWLAHLAPGVVLYSAMPAVLGPEGPWLSTLQGIAEIYLILVTLLAVDAALNAGMDIYETYPIAREIPIKSFVQVAKIILYTLTLIVIMATVLGESPAYVLGSMGVLASVIMLIFKDSILGFVAGIQLAANRMLAKGDWIQMDSHGADGNVIEVALTTVKIRNWDKTITTIPTYALISDSFKNWRGMSESGGRRIKRSVYVDVNSIRLCTPDMIRRFSKIQHISAYVQKKEEELRSWNRERDFQPDDRVNARHLTNVGIFRAYILARLKNHPSINQEMTLMVRQLAPTENGLPIEIYCFTNDTRWAVYEDIQSDIFDHVLAIAREFDLRIFQRPSGSDVQMLNRVGPDKSAGDPLT